MHSLSMLRTGNWLRVGEFTGLPRPIDSRHRDSLRHTTVPNLIAVTDGCTAPPIVHELHPRVPGVINGPSQYNLRNATP